MKQQVLDATDVRILSALQTHGRLSKSQLAEVVNLSPTPCWIRVDKLKKAGIIRGYHADIVLDTVADISQVVVTISLENHRKTDFERFETRIANLKEVTSCIATGGGMDYVLTVVTSNLQTFQALMDTLLSEGLGIDRYMTYIVTRTVKSTQPDLARLLLR